MTSKSAKNKPRGAGRPNGSEVGNAPGPENGRTLPAPGATPDDREPRLALTMQLPGTRLDMVLGGPHPLLLEIVRSLARKAAQVHHAATAADASMPTQTATNKKDV